MTSKGTLLFVALLIVVANAASQSLVDIGVFPLSSHEISSVLPKYPEASFEKKKAGVAVASVVVGIDGSVMKVAVLEAPDSAIKQSVESALRNWRFKPFLAVPGNQPVVVRGRVIFYFRIIEDKPVVINAGKARPVKEAK